MRDYSKKESDLPRRRVLSFINRLKIRWDNNHRYFFNPAFINEHFEKYVHSKLNEVEAENGVQYIESFKCIQNEFVQNLNPLITFLFEGIVKPNAKDILNVCKLDSDVQSIAFVDLCLILSQVEESKRYLNEFDLESDLFNCLFNDNDGLSMRDNLYKYLTKLNLDVSNGKKEQIAITKAVCDLMGSSNNRMNGIITLFQNGLTIDAYILSAALCSNSFHEMIKDLISDKLPTFFPSMKCLRLVDELNYETICEAFDPSTLNTSDPILAYRFVRIALTKLEIENVDLKTKISGRMMLSALLQRTLLVTLIKKDSLTVLAMLEDFWSHVPDFVLSDMFANMERVFFCQLFHILCDVVEVMNYHTKVDMRMSRTRFQYSPNVSSLGFFISTWLQRGWMPEGGKNNNNNDNNLITTYNSILSKFAALTEDTKLKCCLQLTKNILNYEQFFMKSEISKAYKMDDSDSNHVFCSLRKYFISDNNKVKFKNTLLRVDRLLFSMK